MPSAPRPGPLLTPRYKLIAAAGLPRSGISEVAVNASLTFIEGAKPRDEIECALVTQMACTHSAATASSNEIYHRLIAQRLAHFVSFPQVSPLFPRKQHRGHPRFRLSSVPAPVQAAR
jgi:hypothetical protein